MRRRENTEWLIPWCARDGVKAAHFDWGAMIDGWRVQYRVMHTHLIAQRLKVRLFGQRRRVTDTVGGRCLLAGAVQGVGALANAARDGNGTGVASG